MNAEEHYEAAERLLLSCQMPDTDGEAEQYPAREDGVDSVGHALAAAQVHATLALAYGHLPVTLTIDHGREVPEEVVDRFRRGLGAVRPGRLGHQRVRSPGLRQPAARRHGGGFVIPEPEKTLTPIERTRWRLTQLARCLVDAGVPVDTVMLDARQGCDLGAAVLRGGEQP